MDIDDLRLESQLPTVSVVRVLLVDDNPDDRALVARELLKAFPGLDVQQVWDPAGLERMLATRGFDLVITDYHLQWSDGLEVLRAIKSRWPDCPVIMFTGTGTEEVAVEAMKAGLDDYVVKSARHFARLPASVRLVVARARERHRMRVAETRYRALVESVPVGLYRTTPDGRMLDANPALVEMLGYPDRDSLLGVNVRDQYVDPATRATWLEQVDRDQVARDVELRLRRRDGQIIYVLDSARSVRDHTGTPVFYEGSLTDVTLRRAAEVERDRQRRMLQAMLGITPDIVLFKDADTVIQEASETYAWIRCKSRGELIGTTDFDFFAPDQARSFHDEEVRVMSTGEHVMAEHLLDTPYGPRWWEAIKMPVRDDDGRIVGLLSMERDITERKQTTEALRESEELFRLLAEKAQDFIYRADTQPFRHYVYVSPAATTITGYSPEEFYANPDLGRELVHPEDQVAFEASLQAPELHSQPLTLRWVHKNGQIIWTESRIVPIFDSDGKLEAVEGIVRDVTERKQMEDQFLQAQKMETVGRMAGGVAHDFNNLLTAITGFAQFASNALPATDPVRADIEQVLKAAERATHLTRRLLTFSRRHILSTRPINLNELILDLDKMLRRLIGEDVELVTVPMREAAIVNADPGQIEQALVNLAVNARDAMPNGGTLVIAAQAVTLDEDYVRGHVGAQCGEFVRLSIADTGAGMSAEVKAHLFEPFFTTKGVGKGTGLGLAAVYGIVQQHRGYVWVNSELGRGTTVEIYLPLSLQPGDKLPRRDEAGYLPRGSETVLAVEDEPLVRGLTVRILQDLGYQVLQAANGHEALSVAREHPELINLLLTDVVMPHMSGKALAEQLRKLRPAIKVLFTSGYIDATLTDAEALSEGSGFLQKPFSEAVLARKVREILGE